MKELNYPFDENYILTKKKKLKRKLLEEGNNFIEKKVAILGGSTTSDITSVLDLFLLNVGIRAEFYESEYNKYYEEAIFENQKLEKFNPDIIYIHTTNRNITHFPRIIDSESEVSILIENELEKFKTIWNSLRSKYNCPVIQNNFEMPLYRLLGNKDASDIHGKVNFITRLNMEFYNFAQKNSNFYICDINYISADYGLKKWSDPFYYYMYKYALNVNAIPFLSLNIANIIKSIFGKNKKGFVLDMDNTLWGGVIGDDGVDGIALGPEDSEGQAYLEFQKYIKEHKQLGLVLNVASKNEHENALLGLSHPYSELKQSDLIEIKANWDPKDKNFLEIAEFINILPESLVFIDDNPAERHIVSEQLPGVCAPNIQKSHNYIQNIDRNGFFEITTFSKDDMKRNDMYKENSIRKKFQASFSNYKEYLLSLSMEAKIKPFEPAHFPRISQLSNKSNQFNLTTKRYTQSDIENISNSKQYITLYGSLVDKFGDNGIVSIVIGNVVNNECHIDLWLMSCRVLKRDLEYAMIDVLVKYCKQLNIKIIKGYYYPTPKNKMVENFYELLGFEKTASNESGSSEWLFTIPNEYENKNSVIKLEEKNE